MIFNCARCRTLTFYSNTISCLLLSRRTRVLVPLSYSGMAAVSESDYERAVSALNGLQSNFQVLSEMRKQPRGRGKHIFSKTPEFLSRVGIDVTELDSLNVIHVAGTKGKGSVCAMCESILRAHGLKTGFYSSPHLLEVRERIRINGEPLGKDLFVNYFWQCYDSLTRNKELYEEQMPAYFRFLTLLAFKVFLNEKVDVAVVEVGIGGSYDSTNVIQRPVVCGITSLGYDHVDVLGKTIEEITWHKTGICKSGVPLFTSVQSDESLQVILSRGKELQASSVAIAPASSLYPDREKWKIGIAGAHQLENASLAVQLCKQWLKSMSKWNEGEEPLNDEGERCGLPIARPFLLPSSFIKGLSDCVWPGRCQVVKRVGVSYYLDGAHTAESLRVCSNWFSVSSRKEEAEIQGPLMKVLLFNFSGRREAKNLMNEIYSLGFDYALFCPNITSNDIHSSDQANYNVSVADMLGRCYDNEKAWLSLPGVCQKTKVFDCISDAVNWVGRVRKTNKELYVQVLVCGSLHLVGGAMNVLGVTVMGTN
ncbi:PREDICTED: folylpolyglutamate synthase, mitochondrial-like isoform X2 [Amphimedon queenslandica]|uniref:Folylpolyglutamate synthase n=1 Tax=Amphimedon queenslandica TaxID=400682 RepID=A0AAN0JMX0_AMPQE|nr:PREDICTED: folylpolyglutamate synthase, mitochondrial-like isoform X2 [Amphimedon queenslandica]|eukprot:XP_019858163.1 PREDICTED: folylpolyglutamate synthase, mitochondrial-like isoform X2 [Amphimedon queenslandica]